MAKDELQESVFNTDLAPYTNELTRLLLIDELVMAASSPAESAPDPVKDILLCMKKVLELENGVECKRFRGTFAWSCVYLSIRHCHSVIRIKQKQ